MDGADGTKLEREKGNKKRGTVPRQPSCRPDQTNNLYLLYGRPYLRQPTLLFGFPVAGSAFFSPYVREQILCVPRILSHRVRREGNEKKKRKEKERKKVKEIRNSEGGNERRDLGKKKKKKKKKKRIVE